MNNSPREPTATPIQIHSIADQLDLDDDDYEPYGWYKAKLSVAVKDRPLSRPLAKYVDVTAMTPTPFGEGKTVTAIGLGTALSRLGHKTIVTLREPSLAPLFGIKGGGAGGGEATLLPADDINLHFTGDSHAVTAATNLLAATIDNHVARRKSPVVNPVSITWRRAIDIGDKGLAHIISGLDGHPQALLRETGFDLTAASEIMAILALTIGYEDLRNRLERIVIGSDLEGRPVTAAMIGCAGALAALLKDAIRPNLVQTCEHTPAIIHTGPFGNIAHGNSSVLADLMAVRLGDYVVTESGFGADCGAEKFFDIKCRTSGLKPDTEVLVCTIRALKLHSGRYHTSSRAVLAKELSIENVDAVTAGMVNLQAHLQIIRRFGVPVVVAINRFPDDTDRELDAVQRAARQLGAVGTVVVDPFSRGSEGAIDLAHAVEHATREPNRFDFLYPLDMPLDEKIRTIATTLYGAADIAIEPRARTQLYRMAEAGFSNLPVCIAKTQYSLSHDPKLLGRPTGFVLPIREARLAAGAGFVYALAGEISTMPGLPSEPAALRIDIDITGTIRGLA